MNKSSKNVKCVICKVIFKKAIKEINKTNKRNGVHCCSRKCSAVYVSNFHKKNSNPFNFYIIGIKKRNKRVFNDKNIVTAEYLEEIWNKQKGLCALTGIKLVHKKQRSKTELHQASVDRINDSKGYIKGNVQFTTLGANYMRNTFSISEVNEFLNKIYLAKDNKI